MYCNTPTPSECEELEGGYRKAFDFWLHVQFNRVSSKRYIQRANYFDALPGVSGFFRHLCLYDLTCEQGYYVLRKLY
jgi:hypothetical protein